MIAAIFSRWRMGSPSMSAISPVHLDGRLEGEQLHHDCEPTKGGDMDQQQLEEGSRTLFFARCPPTLPHHELLQLFDKFGGITSFNLYRRWAKAKNSKGCGTVGFADKASAAAALAALDGKQQWPESETPMVVEWARADKIRHQGLSSEEATGNKQGIDRQPVMAAIQAGSSSSSVVHKGGQQLSQQPLLHMPKPHSNTDASCISSSGAPSASQRLIPESLTVQTAHLDCCSHAACPPLSDQEAQCSMPSHVVPLMGGMMLNLPPAADGSALCSQHNSTPANFMRQLPTCRDSSTSLPQISPPLAALHGSRSSSCHQVMPGDQGYHSSSYSPASLSNSSNIWSNSSNAAAAMTHQAHAWPIMRMHDNSMLQRGSPAAAAAAAAAAAVHSMSGPLPQVSAGAAAAAAAAPLHHFTTSCLWPSKEREASLFFSAEHAFDNSACSGSSTTAAAAAAAAGHRSSALPQHSSSGGTLPSLLEVIPAMSWLHLRQLEQQNAYSAAAGAAAAAVSAAITMGGHSGNLSGSFAGYSGTSSHVGGDVRAGQAAAPLREVFLDLNAEAAKLLVGDLPFVSSMIGACVDVTVGIRGQLQLRMRGSSSQIEAACGALRTLLLQ